MKLVLKTALWTIVFLFLATLGLFAYLFLTQESETHRLIDVLEKPVRGKIIKPTTTDELKWYFYDAEVKSMPRLYVEKLPADFGTDGDPVLFGKVFTALLLRANERTLTERHVLKLMAEKMNTRNPWTVKESLFFDRMVVKYDCALDKTPPVRMRCLMSKTDAIPVSMGVIQAGIETDWGRQKMSSPFDEKMWFDTARYDNKQYHSLIDAVDGYALLLNSAIPYYRWREVRDKARGHVYDHRGAMFSYFLEAYRPEDVSYTDKVRSFYEQTYLLDLDDATFRD